MSAKKQVTPKTQRRKANVAKKKAVEQKASFEAVFEDIIVAEEPVTTSSVHAMIELEEDDYNPYAPSSLPKGWLKKHAEADMEPEAIIMPFDQPAPEPTPIEKPSLPSPRPVEAVVAPVVAFSPQAPPREPVSDAVIIQRLINGINYLYPKARLTKGANGPQPGHIALIQTNILAAKELIIKLS